MNVRELHSWDVTPDEARRIQEHLRGQVQKTDSLKLDDVRVVVGVDNAYTRGEGSGTAYAVVVTLTFPELEIVGDAYGSRPVSFPYVPGLLTFREAPAVLDAFRQTAMAPDVILFDGQGYAHPRRFGLASHLGVILDLPSIGCAKTRLVGRYDEPDNAFGSWTPLIDRGEQIGAAVRTRLGHAPLFVSVGHKLSLDTAVQIVLACCRQNHFMPEPTRMAHNLVTRYARSASDRS